MGRRWLEPAWVVLLSLLIVGPMLAPGFVLSYDMVFTPRQDLLASSLGLGGGLPRAVPQDAVVAIIEYVVPGMLLQKVILLAIPLLTGLGMLRLLRRKDRLAAVIAATLAMLAPFVSERLIMGHWGLLLGYALTPWAIDAARAVRRTGRWPDVVRLLLLIAAAGLTPSGSLLVTVVALPMVVAPGSALSISQRAATVAGALATWLPWALPAVLHPAVAVSDRLGAQVFALRSEGPWGRVLTALGGGGAWNGEVVPVSREMWVAPLAAVGLCVLAVVGARGVVRSLGRAASLWWLCVSVVGLVAAVVSNTEVWAIVVAEVPGAGLVRDAQKLLAPLTLLIAVGAGFGAARLLRRIPDRGGRHVALVAVLALPVLVQPDVVWGAGGRLRPAEYPSAWAEVRSIVATSDHPGDVVSLPWTAFRRYEWNARRTVLDPAPRWMPRATVVSDDLLVETGAGPVRIQGDDPRAGAISAALTAGQPLAPVLADQGIGWVLLDPNAPEAESPPNGVEPVFTGPDLWLGQVVDPRVRESPLRSAAGVTVMVVDVLMLAGIALGVAALLVRRVTSALRRRNRRGAGESLLS